MLLAFHTISGVDVFQRLLDFQTPLILLFTFDDGHLSQRICPLIVCL